MTEDEITLTPNEVPILHADHGLTPEHFALIDEVVLEHRPPSDRGDDGKFQAAFFLRMVDLPDDVTSLQCALHGPDVGDAPITDSDVEYVPRNGRPGPSRLVNRPTRPARRMVVIGIWDTKGFPTVFTAYGTRAEAPTPREWWDASMKPSEAVDAATFWSVHALSKEA